MEKSFADILTDEMIALMGTIKEQTREMFRNKQPYRTVHQSEAEKIANYLSMRATMPPEVDAQLTNDPQVGEAYQEYNQKMEDSIRGYK